MELGREARAASRMVAASDVATRNRALLAVREAIADQAAAVLAANAEDVARGGQTLATLLVYLNDVDDGGRTRFNKLDITVAPRKGDACLFFPADASGQFDERLEHEGEAPRAEKWIGRIWVHQKPITGETGCPPGTLEALRNR